MILTDFTTPLRRREYMLAGYGLALLKYAVDAAAVRAVSGIVWTPLDYLAPSLVVRGDKIAQFPAALSIFLFLWTLPFMWIGVALSIRRARDADVSLWSILFFFIPFLNYVYMAALSLAPTHPSTWDSSVPARYPPAAQPDRSVGIGILAGVAAAVATTVVCVGVFKWYGSSLFLGTPFMIGVVSAYAANRIRPRRTWQSLLVGICSLVATGLLLVGIAFEGALCLIMAVPIALPVVMLGALAGQAIARVGPERTATLVLLVGVLPATSGIEQRLVRPAERVVLTSIDIDAPPETVWRHVVTFSEITAPPGWWFRAGLAYPVRARIDGAGPGAVRYCEFSTGSFREPITVWDEPRRLAFDVAAQPPPLREWSPYSHVYAPHVDGFFRTSRGEFQLVPVAGGRTRLEGRTWYSLDMAPALYWTPIADAIVHTIHRRVLEHISREASSRS